jgi:pimeloyl-ACP methyl ester carboxylesterase
MFRASGSTRSSGSGAARDRYHDAAMMSRWWWGPKRGGELWTKDRSVRSFDGTTIRYTLLGDVDAPVVSLCAGFLCPDTYWKYLVRGLEDAYRVLVWNYRGVGVSDLPRRPGFHAVRIRDDELSIEVNAKDLRAIWEAEGIERSALIGHSMGTQTTLEAYERYPEQVWALVSIAGAYRSPLRTFYGTDLSARLAPVGLPLLHAFPRVTLLAWRALLRSPLSFPVGRHLLRAVGPGASAEDMAGYFEHLSMSDPLIAAKMIRGMHEHSAEDVLPHVAVPVLVVHGTNDPFTPKRVATAMARTIPDARLAFVDGGSHTLPIEQPDTVLGAVRPFLDDAFAPA